MEQENTEITSEIIEQRKKQFASFLKKNNFVKIFFVLAAICIFFALLTFLIKKEFLFAKGMWLLLGIAFIFSMVFSYFDRKRIMFIPIVLWLVVLGVSIRSLPMTDHNGTPGLWDITTNTWTLGPDLDPFLFLRQAKTIAENGSLPKIDYMRNIPLGFDNSYETKLLPSLIAYLYKFLKIFKDTSIEYAGVVFPVVMFALTILAFFLFVREIFLKKDNPSEIKPNIIALISTLFMIVVPDLLPRTIAGIPEKESAAFFFMFMAFYLFLKSWKTDKRVNSVIFAVLSGFSTAFMGLVWGGVSYAFITIGLSVLISFIIGKVEKKEFFSYSFWLIATTFGLVIFSNKYSLVNLILSVGTGIAFLTFFIILFHFILWNTRLSKIKALEKIKLPKTIISLIIAFVLGIILLLILSGPSAMKERADVIIKNFIRPVTGRWSITVAENKQPYFTEWVSQFGPILPKTNIPVLFWIFFIGSIILFKEMTNKIRRKDSWKLTGLYFLLLIGVIFSRYAPHPSLFDGENFISRLLYFGSLLLFAGYLIYVYIKYYKENNESFKNIDYGSLFLFSLFVLCLFTTRGAVRLIMVLAPVAVIFLGYTTVRLMNLFKHFKDETLKIILIIIMILVLILDFFIFFGDPFLTKTAGFYPIVQNQAYSYIPSYYTNQWQEAMKWIREETPKDAVFAHWWDYGYWVQTMGNRATVLDGGNAIVWWNYLMGRNVLTGDNQKDSLEYLWNHNATYLLIDSSDIGKYGAFSSIGSDANYDRYSWIGTFLMDTSQTQETSNQTIYVYTGGIGFDEDLIINESGKQILLPKEKSGAMAIILPSHTENNKTEYLQPYIVAVYQNNQYKVDLKYLNINDKFIKFDTGIEAAAYIFPKIDSSASG